MQSVANKLLSRIWGRSGPRPALQSHLPRPQRAAHLPLEQDRLPHLRTGVPLPKRGMNLSLPTPPGTRVKQVPWRSPSWRCSASLRALISIPGRRLLLVTVVVTAQQTSTTPSGLQRMVSLVSISSLPVQNKARHKGSGLFGRTSLEV